MQIYSDRVFVNPLKIIEAFDNESFFDSFYEIEKLKDDFYLLGYIRYEAKDIFLNKKIKSEYPLLYFEVFDKYEKYDPDCCNKEIYLNPISQISYEEYSGSLKKIKNHIALGNTYQVNYTYEYLVESEADSITLYESILKNQKTPYNAFIKNKYEEILSFSPELFFEIEGNIIKTKPMKGTVKRGNDIMEDQINIDFLKNDIKNRAENVMIVDLLRNDLGKIAKTGSVKVDKLFEIETHKTLHQMTSEITAEREEDTTFLDIFKAIFPCGSITGAPKIKTMEIIEELEKGDRDIYCGAIGLISKEKTVFSVPIRILHKSVDENSYRLRVGGAIVWDSDTLDEWEETKTKIKFLNYVDEFALIETIKVENYKLIDSTAHFDRMKKSAEHFNFKFNPDILNIQPEKDGILRVLLSKNGEYTSEYKPLVQNKTNKIRISEKKINSSNEFLYHKTTYRPWYKDSLEEIVSGNLYDEIFINEKDELTEGSRTNVLVEIEGKLYTPPVSSGLLNGVERRKMLDNGNCFEKVITIAEFKNAKNIYCINSVRGVQRVELI